MPPGLHLRELRAQLRDRPRRHAVHRRRSRRSGAASRPRGCRRRARDDDAARACDDLVAEPPQRDGGRDALRDRHLAQVGLAQRRCRSRPAGRSSFAGTSVAPSWIHGKSDSNMLARRSNDVDEVDAAGPGRILAALHRRRAAPPGAPCRAGGGSRSTGRGRARPPQRRRARRARPPAAAASSVRAHLEEDALQAAVDDERLAADVARAVGGEEADDVAELLRRAPAASGISASCRLGRAVRVELRRAARSRCGRARRS